MLGKGHFDACATNKQSSMQIHRPHLGQLVRAALRALLLFGTTSPGSARLNPARLTPRCSFSGERLAV